MAKVLKKLLGLAVIGSLVVTSNHITALANSKVSENFHGTAASGSIQINSTSAIAITNYSQPAYIEAAADVYYRYNGKMLSDCGYSTNTIGGASATATVSRSGAVVTGGKGIHAVSISNPIDSWVRETQIGTVQ